MSELQNYDSAVEVIKTAILQSQYDAVRTEAYGMSTRFIIQSWWRRRWANHNEQR